MIKLNILGQDWKIHLHSDEDFCSKYGEADAAFVLPSIREAHFNDDEISLLVIKHEVWHIFRAALCTSSASLTSDQEEEISAELFGTHGDHMLRMSRNLYKALKELNV